MKNKHILLLLLIIALLVPSNSSALSKDETVYVTLNNDGQVNNIIVSEHLNNNGDKLLKDKSNLKDIKNVNGDESYSMNNDSIIWESNGNDIYYQGKTDKELPIDLQNYEGQLVKIDSTSLKKTNISKKTMTTL